MTRTVRLTRTALWAAGLTLTLGLLGTAAVAADDCNLSGVNMVCTNGNDTYTLDINVDEFRGRDGNDNLTVSDGSSATYLLGQRGNDTLTNEGDVEEIDGGDGDDTITNESYAEYVLGGQGNDTVTNNGYIDEELRGGQGNDNLTNNGEASEMRGGEGDDIIYNSGSGETGDIHGGEGNDQITNDGDANELLGGEGDDIIINNAAAEGIYGRDGNDTIINYGDVDDYLDGDDGDDTITNEGSVYGIYGSRGNDNIENAGETFFIDGGRDDDTILNSGAVFYIAGGGGSDSITNTGMVMAIDAEGGDDTVTVLAGSYVEYLDGGNGFDTLVFDLTPLSEADANAIAAQLALLSPAGGTLEINGWLYEWSDFEELAAMLAAHVGQTVTVRINDGRLNAYDLAAPVAIYCSASGLNLYAVNSSSRGVPAFSMTYEALQVAAPGLYPGDYGVIVTIDASGIVLVQVPAASAKTYSFSLSRTCVPTTGIGVES